MYSDGVWTSWEGRGSWRHLWSITVFTSRRESDPYAANGCSIRYANEIADRAVDKDDVDALAPTSPSVSKERYFDTLVPSVDRGL